MAAGEVLSAEERARLQSAVSIAEARTGLQFCVYLGPGTDDCRRDAERLFRKARFRSRPAVLLYVAPDVRRVECVVAPEAIDRIPDPVSHAVVSAMLPAFAEGQLLAGLECGLAQLAHAAGGPRGDEPGEELPDVIG